MILAIDQFVAYSMIVILYLMLFEIVDKISIKFMIDFTNNCRIELIIR